MKRVLTTCKRCGREIGFYTDKNLQIGDRHKLAKTFCNPVCESKGAYDPDDNGLSIIVGDSEFITINHFNNQRIINSAPKWFVDL